MHQSARAGVRFRDEHTHTLSEWPQLTQVWFCSHSTTFGPQWSLWQGRNGTCRVSAPDAHCAGVFCTPPGLWAFHWPATFHAVPSSAGRPQKEGGELGSLGAARGNGLGERSVGAHGRRSALLDAVQRAVSAEAGEEGRPGLRVPELPTPLWPDPELRVLTSLRVPTWSSWRSLQGRWRQHGKGTQGFSHVPGMLDRPCAAVSFGVFIVQPAGTWRLN